MRNAPLFDLSGRKALVTGASRGIGKSGLLGMTRALAAEWADLGQGHRPGYFRTAMTEVFYGNEACRQSMLAKIPQHARVRTPFGSDAIKGEGC